MRTFYISFEVLKSLDSGPIFVQEDEILIDGLREFDEIFFKMCDAVEYQGFSTREVYPSWKQDLFFFLGNTGSEEDGLRSLMVGPSIQKVEVHAIEPLGIWVWHRHFLHAQRKDPTTPQSLLSQGRCPKCGVEGEFVRTALCCPRHGAYAGI